jgi:hypothetical protein
MEEAPQSNISYHEYRVISHLLTEHVRELQTRLKAMVAFGELVTSGETADIDLLEIVDGWRGKRYGEFSGTAAGLPLRSRLRLHVLTPEELEDPGVIRDPDERAWVEDILRRAREGYEIIMETPPGYAREILERPKRLSASTAPPSGAATTGNVLDFVRSG